MEILSRLPGAATAGDLLIHVPTLFAVLSGTVASSVSFNKNTEVAETFAICRRFWTKQRPSAMATDFEEIDFRDKAGFAPFNLNGGVRIQGAHTYMYIS